jgi:hypothetical protein
VNQISISTAIADALAVRFNGVMEKTEKELAFIHDLYVTPDWTQRFAELVDKNVELEKAENLAYLNAGTGDHCFAIREKLDERIAIFGACENEDLLLIARDKAIALRSDVDFSTLRYDDDSFDAVIADASLIPPAHVYEFFDHAIDIARTGASVTLYLPSAGSFGEVFSLLWEVFFNEDLGEHGDAAAEKISELVSVSALRTFASNAGLRNVRVESATEIFEFDNGAAFVASPLVADFLMPHWLDMLAKDKKERVKEQLAQLIDAEDGSLSFRFSIKATVVTGKKS